MLPIALIFITGFAASIGQIMVLRELLVLFHGNELSTGLVLACWLLWTAAGSGLLGRIKRNDPPGLKTIVVGLGLCLLSLPATIIWVRAARIVWSVPVGELISPGLMFAIALSSTGPICFLSGALFALCWSYASASQHKDGEHGALAVYLAEAAGAGAGGLFYYFFILPAFPSFAGSLFLCLLIVVPACIIVMRARFPGKTTAIIFSLAVVLTAGGLLAGSGKLDFAARRLQWGTGFIESRDTPYHNLSFLGSSGQYSLFCNGLWLYSVPDPQTAQPAAHMPLLQNPRPERVLVAGDFSPGLVSEILKHPGVAKVDCVQADRELIRFAGEILTGANSAYPVDTRLQIHYIDPNLFLKTSKDRYSVVIIGAGEPINAEMNRFYTVEFFSRIKNVLARGGVFSFTVPSAPDIIGKREAKLLQSLKHTLDAVFESVIVVVGEGATFFAGDAGAVSKDPMLLIQRMRERQLNVNYLRDFHLLDRMNPLRVAYIDSVLGGSVKSRINRDFEPVCYLYGLQIWGGQLHPKFGMFFDFLSGGGHNRFRLPGAFGMLFLIAIYILRARSGPEAAIAFNTALCGAILILLEIVLILVYQIINGAMYKQMALIISLFMAGIAVGGGIGRSVAGNLKPLFRLFFVQVALAGYVGMLALFLGMLRDVPTGNYSSDIIFPSLAFIAGALGGGQFAMAVRAKSGIIGVKSAGPWLYAADLIGAAGGAVVGSLFLLPVFGITNTLMGMGAAVLAGSITFLGGRRGVKG